jgi:hypothetical protein
LAKAAQLGASPLSGKPSEEAVGAGTALCPAAAQHWDQTFRVPQLEAGFRWALLCKRA